MLGLDLLVKGKKRQAEWKVSERYGTSHLCLERPPGKYVRHIDRLDRRHSGLSMGLLTGRIHSQYVRHKKRTAKDLFMQRIRYIFGLNVSLTLERRVKAQTPEMFRTDPDQISRVRRTAFYLFKLNQ